MRRTGVVSSNITSVGYHPETETLEIEFRHGGVYQYFGVPMDRYAALAKAVSKGGYFSQHVKSTYPFQRVWEAD